MNLSLVVRPLAKQDLVEQFVFIAEKSEQAALQFLIMAERTFEELKEIPKMGSPMNLAHPQLRDLRKWRVRDFEKHLIFYKPLSNGIEIIRVLYASRDIISLLENL